MNPKTYNARTPARRLRIRHSIFGFLSSFVIRHSSFLLLLLSAKAAPSSPPSWAAPSLVESSPASLTVRSGDLELVHSREVLGGFSVRIGSQLMAIGQNRPQLAYMSAGETKWLDLANASGKTLRVQRSHNGIEARFACSDADGGRWIITQQFEPGLPGRSKTKAGSISVITQVTVDQDREVVFLPMLILFPGAGGFGQIKGQGLFAGLEYLDNEPSSSEADVIGPASKRQVPDNLKITMPLMAIQNGDRYLALTWTMSPQFCALFDSPDRIFHSGGHVMGLLFPGADGKSREEGNLLPRQARMLRANEPMTSRAALLGGKGQTIVPAVQQYVALNGLPALPQARLDLQGYVAETSGGWLDSKIREGSLFRHAVGGNFGAGPAADAALWVDWLASRSLGAPASSPASAGLGKRAGEDAKRLQATAAAALEQVAPADWNASGVGHVRYPAVSLSYGHVAESAARAEQTARQMLGHFEPDGTARYHAAAGQTDLGKTHFTNEACGFTARYVEDLLEAAAFCGNRELLAAGIQRLRALDRFQGGVPRGAQTWECPLHTPDILASANMVRAYTLGYELTGEPQFLQQARYWAWTGVPFIYLVNPTDKPIGLYATIAVFGATQWRAPVWMGLPVQWCGLVYAEALYRLARQDPNGPWTTLADGITFSGVEQSWPQSDASMQGLLPDSFVLRSQTRNGPAINPATLQACAARYFHQLPVYDFWCFRANGLKVHAPGQISQAKESPDKVSFEVQCWRGQPYFVLINGLARKPHLRLNGKPTGLDSDRQFLEREGRLILKLDGKTRVELGL